MSYLNHLPVVVIEALRMGLQDVHIQIKGYPRFNGDAVTICREIVNQCFNGAFFQGSLGHFKQLWIRDVGMFANSFIRQGLGAQFRKTLDFALSVYKCNGRITTTVLNNKHAVDIYDTASDTLPFLLHALNESESFELLTEHQSLLSGEISRVTEKLVNPQTGLVREEIYVSGAKDCVRRFSSTYDNCMMAWLGRLIQEIEQNGICRLPNPVNPDKMKETICNTFWTGSYFREDLKASFVSSDANVWPFYIGLFDDQEMKRKALQTLQTEGLDKPFPLKYSKEEHPERELFFPRIFTPNYQGNTIWAQLGLCYTDILSGINANQARMELSKIKQVIETYGNVLELFEPDGAPYKGRVYRGDHGMIWAVHFLDLWDRLKP